MRAGFLNARFGEIQDPSARQESINDDGGKIDPLAGFIQYNTVASGDWAIPGLEVFIRIAGQLDLPGPHRGGGQAL